MNRNPVCISTSACTLFLVAVGAAAETHPFSVHDMLAMDRISEPRVSPDATQIVFVRRTTDLEADKGRTDLWMVRTDGSGLRRLTSDPGVALTVDQVVQPLGQPEELRLFRPHDQPLGGHAELVQEQDELGQHFGDTESPGRYAVTQTALPLDDYAGAIVVRRRAAGEPIH